MPDENETILERGEIINNEYIVERYIGGGAFGEVYRVKHKLLHNRLALKVFKISLEIKGNEQSIEEFLEEAIILADIAHRNIVRVHTAGSFIAKDEKEYVYFTMDYISTGDLDDYWKRYGLHFIPVDEVIDIIKQVCLGLNVLHSKKPPMIHRDIKPQNIMIGYDDEGLVAKLTDFGLVKTVSASTLYATAKGTLAFKAPEYLEEKDDTSTDIFSVGVTFYMLLTDKLPYTIESEFDVLTGAHFKNTPKPLNYYNPLINDEELEKIVFKSISTTPEERYQNAQELLDAINEWESKKEKHAENTTQELEDERVMPEIFTTEQTENTTTDPIQNIAETPEKPEVKASVIPEGSIANLSDAFEYFNLNGNKKDKKSDEELINLAISAVDSDLNYEKGVEYLEDVENLEDEYESKLKLWKCFLLIKDSSTTDEGISQLRELTCNDTTIANGYSFVLDVLSSKDSDKLKQEAFKYQQRYDLIKASTLMELAILLDEKLKNKYKYKLDNWKKGRIN